MSHTRHPERKVVNFSAGPSAMPYEVSYFQIAKPFVFLLYYFGVFGIWKGISKSPTRFSQFQWFGNKCNGTQS